jgi:uncharacterized MnhB-related membrane protein
MIEVLLGLLIVLAVLALLARDLLVAVVVTSVFSLVTCLVFFLWHAPDVALTEAAVGTGVGTVVFVWAVSKTERKDST